MRGISHPTGCKAVTFGETKIDERDRLQPATESTPGDVGKSRLGSPLALGVAPHSTAGLYAMRYHSSADVSEPRTLHTRANGDSEMAGIMTEKPSVFLFYSSDGHTVGIGCNFDDSEVPGDPMASAMVRAAAAREVELDRCGHCETPMLPDEPGKICSACREFLEIEKNEALGIEVCEFNTADEMSAAVLHEE